MHLRTKALSISPRVKKAVFERDGGKCVWCGRPGLPEAHFIRRSKSGLGIEENILTLCRAHHFDFDSGSIEQRQCMREYFRKYLKEYYPEWDESKLVYRKD